MMWLPISGISPIRSQTSSFYLRVGGRVGGWLMLSILEVRPQQTCYPVAKRATKRGVVDHKTTTLWTHLRTSVGGDCYERQGRRDGFSRMMAKFITFSLVSPGESFTFALHFINYLGESPVGHTWRDDQQHVRCVFVRVCHERLETSGKLGRPLRRATGRDVFVFVLSLTGWRKEGLLPVIQSCAKLVPVLSFFIGVEYMKLLGFHVRSVVQRWLARKGKLCWNQLGQDNEGFFYLNGSCNEFVYNSFV